MLNWAEEARRWQLYDLQTARETNKAVLAAINKDLNFPAKIRENFPAILAGVRNLLEEGRDTGTAVQIISALGTLPQRWGYSAHWEYVVQAAVHLTGRRGEKLHPQHAHLLAIHAELLLFSDKLTAARRVARQSNQMARLNRQPGALSMSKKTLLEISLLLDHNLEIDREITAMESELRSWGLPDAEVTRWSLALKTLKVLDLRNKDQTLAARNLAAENLLEIERIGGAGIHLESLCYQMAGVMAWVNGLLVETQHNFERAAALYELAGDSMMQGFNHANLALVHLSRGALEQAEIASRTSVEINEKIHNHSRFVNSLGLLGLAYYCAGRFSESRAIFRRQVSLARQVHNPRSYHLAVDNINFLLVMQGKYQQARDRLLKSKHYYQQQNARERLLGVEIGLLLCHYGMGEMAAASSNAAEIEIMIQQPGLERNHPVALRTISLCRPPEEARQLLVSAYDLAILRGYRMEQAACYLLLARLEEDPTIQAYLWQTGADQCIACGAANLLDGRSISNPPFLPFII